MKDTDYSNKASRPPSLLSMENAGKFEINIEKLEKYKYSFVRFVAFNLAKN